jgi:hypothetical protein
VGGKDEPSAKIQQSLCQGLDSTRAAENDQAKEEGHGASGKLGNVLVVTVNFVVQRIEGRSLLGKARGMARQIRFSQGVEPGKGLGSGDQSNFHNPTD